MFQDQKEKAIHALTERLDRDHDKKTRLIIFSAGFLGNVAAWLTILFIPDSVFESIGFLTDVVDKIGTYLIAFPFACVFVMTYVVCVMRRMPLQDSGIEDDDFFGRYRDHVANESKRNIILISAAVGGLNAILLVFAALTFR